jgi:hypothetical protein
MQGSQEMELGALGNWASQHLAPWAFLEWGWWTEIG